MQVKADILKMPQENYKKRLIIELAVCIVLIVVALIVNVCLSVFRTDDTHTAFLVINIVFDVLILWAVYTVADSVMVPQLRRYKLIKSAKTSGEKITGKTISVEGRQRIQKMDCLTLEIECGDRIRKVFVIENTLESELQAGEEICVLAVNNIAVACGVENEP